MWIQTKSNGSKKIKITSASSQSTILTRLLTEASAYIPTRTHFLFTVTNSYSLDLLCKPTNTINPPHPKLKSAITASSTLSVPKKTKGRGFRQDSDSAANRNSHLTGSGFDTLTAEGGPGPQRSIEGWIILVTGVHEEALMTVQQ
ncbi:unnamed protein product [Vicia faba]|uniref:Uncharacterized protein n=1 Tax=Vicia faba TaxID=3906 RepID=A0AAV1B9K0_VICFA|nr:unnamed protein product [Vicia faba]